MTSTPRPISIVTVDKHEVVGAGIAAWCDGSEGRIRAVTHVVSATALLRTFPSPSASVDVVVIEPETPDRRPGLTALQRICAAGHRVVTFSQLTSDEFVLRALRAGSACYVAKSEGRRHLLPAIRAAYGGARYAPPTMAAATEHGVDRRAGLTDRELQTVVAWSRVSSKAHAAERLAIKESTVRTHIERARAKYAAAGRPATTKAALLARLIQDGLLGPQDV